MRIVQLEFARYNWCVELALKAPWEWHPLLERWLSNKNTDGQRHYLSWADMETRLVYIAFNTQREAEHFASYAALLGIER